jgi:hypothetical protein
MPKLPTQSFDRGVTIAFLAAVILIAVWTLSSGIWWGALFDGKQTWLIDLPKQPVWSPPSPPSYADFRREFNELPPEQSKEAATSIKLKWDFMLTTFLLYLWGTSVLFAAITLPGPAELRNIGIHVIRSLALSLSGSAAACVAIWLAIGGWGPPSPNFFGVAGLVIGIWMGVVTFSRRK